MLRLVIALTPRRKGYSIFIMTPKDFGSMSGRLKNCNFYFIYFIENTFLFMQMCYNLCLV